eukprot:356868-Chlamydomonas_euryale.AAC.23
MGKWGPDSHGQPRRGQVDLSYLHPSIPRVVESFYTRFLQLPLEYSRVTVHSRCGYGDTCECVCVYNYCEQLSPR